MRPLVVLFILISVSVNQVTAAAALAPQDQLVHDLLRELIGIDTTHSTGSTGKAAEAMAVRLRAAGFPDADLQILGPRPQRNNLVARIHGKTGSGKSLKPILLISHLDVVEANKEDWTTDPFQFIESSGWYYGRGAMDIKSGVATLVANFIRWRQEGWRPNRDVILALTADEEAGGSGGENGVEWLLKNHRNLIDAEYCINPDGGNVEMKKGKNLLQEMQYSEKAFLSFTFETTDKGGHSSLPGKENAIYHLAGALDRLSKFDFPVMLDAGRRAYFEALAGTQEPKTRAAINKMLSTTPPDPVAVAELSESADWNAMLRTTCVATMLTGGHAENALPQMARATINCRILPDQNPAEVWEALKKVAADPKVKVTPVGRIEDAVSPASALRPDVMQAARTATNQVWPGLTVVPVMSQGASDGRILRTAGIPTYGISGLADDYDDVRAHGKDERISPEALFQAREFIYQFVNLLAQ